MILKQAWLAVALSLGCCKKIPLLGSLHSRDSFLTLLETVKFKIKVPVWLDSWWPFSWLCHHLICPICMHAKEGFCVSSFYKELNPYGYSVLKTSSNPNYTPMIRSLNTGHWGLGFQCKNWRDAHSLQRHLVYMLISTAITLESTGMVAMSTWSHGHLVLPLLPKKANSFRV